MSLDKKFSLADVSIQEERTVYKGFFRIKKILLKHALFRGGTSATMERELFCRGDSVGVLLYDPWSDRVGLVKQFRIGCLHHEHGPWVWEVIAGVNDKKDKNPEQAVIREVMEESGISLRLENLVSICRYYSSPGGSDERLQLYCAMTRLEEGENIFGLENEHEDILFKTFSYQEAINAMLSGLIDNAATIIALQWLQFNHDRLKGKVCAATKT